MASYIKYEIAYKDIIEQLSTYRMRASISQWEQKLAFRLKKDTEECKKVKVPYIQLQAGLQLSHSEKSCPRRGPGRYYRHHFLKKKVGVVGKHELTKLKQWSRDM